MMRRLFVLLAAVAIGSLSACKDDNGPADWRELPTEEISGENAALSVNGSPVTGSVKLVASDGTHGKLTMSKVLPGWCEVEMDVALSPGRDTYGFTGEKKLSTPPSMMDTKADMAQDIFTVSVKGSLSLDGKVIVEAASELSTAAQGGLSGTWSLSNRMETVDGMVVKAPLKLTWTPKNPDEPNMLNLSNLAGMFGSGALNQLLDNVTLNPDGNITADYWEEAEISMDNIMNGDYVGDSESIFEFKADHVWTSSPKNVALWYVRNDRIYIVPDISAIAAIEGEDSISISNEDIATIMSELAGMGVDVAALMPVVRSWITAGVPLRYAVQNGTLKLYVDKAMAAPVIEALLPALKKLDPVVEEIKADPDNELGSVLNLVFMMIGIEKPSDIETIWRQNTDQFEIALTFTQTSQNKSFSGKVKSGAECIYSVLKNFSLRSK